MVRTTIALEASTRDRLLELKRRRGARSTDEVVRWLLDGPAVGARALYQAHKHDVDAVAEAHGITHLVAFGSRARGDARPDSDLDLLVGLPADADLYDLVHVQVGLSKAFGVNVDAITEGSLTPRLRAAIDQEGIRLAAA